MQMNSTMSNQEFFAKGQTVEMQRSQFDRSHTYKTTFNAGFLIPFYVDFVNPSDTINLQCRVFGRLATPLKPVMDNIFIDVHFFSVPYRLVWSNFKKMMGEKLNPTDSINYTIPQMIGDGPGFTALSNADYMGIPTNVPGLSVNALPFRAQRLIWNEWFRDQDIQDSLTVDMSDSNANASDYKDLMPRGKRKDYFTSARPWAQKGTAVSIPMDIPTNVPVITNGSNPVFTIGGSTGTRLLYGTAGVNDVIFDTAPGTTGNLAFGPVTGLQASLTDIGIGTIDQLNLAYKLQMFLQADSRGGTRYTELIQSHFGVVSPDARLQRPEFLGGGTTYVNINPVTQTTPASGGSTPQGNLAAYGTFSGEPASFTKSFTEHEIVIGFLSARADLTYQQGLARQWSYKTRFDHYWREFANLGEQAILNKEIYAQGPTVINPSTGIPYDDEVFGYAERYSEQKFKHSLVTGAFRSNYPTSLDVWHLAQEFGDLPTLQPSFIWERPPIDRIIAVSTEPQFIVDIVCEEKWARPMPVFAIPSFSTKF